jgi:hypothetical protein
VTNSQKGKNPLSTCIIYDKGREYPSFLEKNILPQIGKDVPHAETTTGKGF